MMMILCVFVIRIFSASCIVLSFIQKRILVNKTLFKARDQHEEHGNVLHTKCKYSHNIILLCFSVSFCKISSAVTP